MYLKVGQIASSNVWTMSKLGNLLCIEPRKVETHGEFNKLTEKGNTLTGEYIQGIEPCSVTAAQCFTKPKK